MSDVLVDPAATTKAPLDQLGTTLDSGGSGQRSASNGSSMSRWDSYDPNYFYPSLACVLLFGVMGIVGNMLLLCVMKRPHLKNKSYAHFLSALAVCDSSNILFQFFYFANYMVKMLSGQYITAAFGNAGCKIYDFLERIFLFNSAWLIVCITVERFLVIYFPCRGRIFCRAKKALALVVVVCVASCCSQVVRFAWVIRDNNGLCAFTPGNAEVATGIDIFFEAVLFYVLPSFTILILNVLTLIRMNGFIRHSSSSPTTITTAATHAADSHHHPPARHDSFRNSAALQEPVVGDLKQQQAQGLVRGEPCTASSASGSGGGTNQLLLKYFPRLRRNSRRATWILLTISFTYLLCCVPNLVCEIYWHVKLFIIGKGELSERDRDAFLDYYFRYRFVLHVFKMINYGSNFYTYMLFGKSFRREVTTLLNLSSSSGPPSGPMLANGQRQANGAAYGGGYGNYANFAPGGCAGCGANEAVVMMRLPGAPNFGPTPPPRDIKAGPPPDLLLFHRHNGHAR